MLAGRDGSHLPRVLAEMSSVASAEAPRMIQLSAARLPSEAHVQHLSDAFCSESALLLPLVDYESLSAFVRLSRLQM